MADTTILSWITAEVDQALERVRRQLAAYRTAPADRAPLAACPEHLHQVSGALNMVGLSGATRFCEALERSLTGLEDAGAEAAAVLDRAVLELRQFVDDVARGQPNVPTRLFPVYRELVHLQGREDSSEIELFFPDLTPPAPSHPRPLSIEHGDLPAFLQSQRTRWQRGILGWIRQQPQALEDMRETLDVIHSVAHLLPERRALWWVAGGLVDALLDVAQPQRLAHARSLWNKIDIYIRDLAQGQDRPPDNEPLLRELLYTIACCPPLTQRLRDVKRLYGLDALLPAHATRAPDVDTLQPILDDVRLRLQAVQQTWQQYLEGEPSGAVAFRERLDALKQRAGALSSMPLTRLLEALCQAAAALPDARPADSDAMLAEMASAFLLAESILETFHEPAADLAAQVGLLARWLGDAAAAGTTTAAPAGLRSELTQYVNSLQLRSQVAKEMLANLQQIEQVLDGYARGQKEAAELRGVAPQLRQIHGALSVLGWDRAVAVLERCESLMPTLARGSASLDWVAEGLSALELFISPCVNGREPRQASLDLFLERAAQQPAPEKGSAQAAAPSEELLQVFLEEAVEVLASMGAGLAACRAEPEKVEALAGIRRGFHTLKGSARMVGLSELGDAAWEVERAMNRWLEQKQPASTDLLELVALAHERFSVWVSQLRAGEALVVDAASLRQLAAGLRAQEDPAARMLEIYFKEAAAHAATLQAECRGWREQPQAEASPEFMRAAHTLASSSRTAGFADVAALAAALEQWIPLARRTVEPGDAAIVGRCVDTLAAMVAAAGSGEARRGGDDALAALRALKDRLQVPPRPKDKRTARDDIDPHLLPVFLDEARELLPQLGTDLRDWKASPQDRSAADAVKRALHTLKGSARMAGAIRLGELTHLMESRIEYALEAGELTAELFEDLEAKMDRLSADLEKLGTPTAAGSVPVAAAVPGQAAPSPPAAPGATAPAALLRVSADRLDRLITEAGEAAIARSRIEAELRQVKQALGELSESVSRLRTQLREVEIQADSQMQSRRAVLEEREGEFDPLEFDRYTRLQELTRMMAEGLSDAASLQQALLKSVGETDAALLQQARISRELQQDLMRMRALPFASLAERLHRVVRQTARELGKKAELDVEGGQVELDRGVLERMAPPLEHMLRNALVHGIEAPQTRAAAGKPETGRISIALRQEANQVVISLADDGAGIDGARLRARAVAKGLIPAAQDLSAEESVQLIFLSGLSTAEAVSELAGRGIGMDVVRSEVNAIGGRVEANAAAGRGTTFTIYLPLTLAVTQTLMVRAGPQRFAIASAAVEQVLRMKADELVTGYEQTKVVFRGSDYPLHYLHQLLGGRSATAIAGYNAVLLVRGGTQRLALHVDELIGSREMVVKNIGPQLARVPGVAGATVMPDGSIVLIVNPLQLAARAALPAVRTTVPELAEGEERAPLVMVVDDSITVRKVTGRLLEREGYRVRTAKDGVDALEQLKGELPAVMLVDIEMPRMDGFDLARNVRGDPRTMEIPIIVISSRSAAKHRSRAADLGVNVFLGKPYEEAELVRQVAAFAAR